MTHSLTAKYLCLVDFILVRACVVFISRKRRKITIYTRRNRRIVFVHCLIFLWHFVVVANSVGINEVSTDVGWTKLFRRECAYIRIWIFWLKIIGIWMNIINGFLSYYSCIYLTLCDIDTHYFHSRFRIYSWDMRHFGWN